MSNYILNIFHLLMKGKDNVAELWSVKGQSSNEEQSDVIHEQLHASVCDKVQPDLTPGSQAEETKGMLYLGLLKRFFFPSKIHVKLSLSSDSVFCLFQKLSTNVKLCQMQKFILSEIAPGNESSGKH